MFGRKPKQNQRSYIVVLDTGTFWADEFGVVSEPVPPGTFHQLAGTDNSHFAEAVLLASMLHTHLGRIESKVGALADHLTGRQVVPLGDASPAGRVASRLTARA